MQTKTARFQLLTLLAAAIILTACAMGGATVTQSKKQAYIDARLRFSISYPEAWASFLTTADLGPYSADAVVWDMGKENLFNGPLTVSVISIPGNGLVAGAGLMLEVMSDLYPNFSRNFAENVHLPAGPAIMLNGYTPQQTFRVWFIDGEERQYLLICSSSPELFTEHIPLFEEIAQSFQVLE